jgi:hypothetical protein
MAYVVKAEITQPDQAQFSFPMMKTMYAGKKIAVGDVIYVFASENEGGNGLIARGIVTKATPAGKRRTPGRHTPRVSIEVKRLAKARRPLGRAELQGFRQWGDGRPQTELCFKLYRQATNKVVGISDDAEKFLRTFF